MNQSNLTAHATPIDEAVGLLAELRAASSELFASLQIPLGGAALADRLGIERTLGWKLARIAGGVAPAEAVRLAPGRASVSAVIEAAAAAGAPTPTCRHLRESFDRYESWKSRHGSNRAVLAAIVADLDRAASDDDPDQTLPDLTLADRRSATRAMAALWGLHAAVQFKMDVIAPSALDAHRLDIATASGLLGMQAFRSDLRWPLAKHRLASGAGETRPGEIRPLTPADPARAGAADEPGLIIRDFCQGPVPEVLAVPQPDGAVRYDLTAWPLGATSPISVVMGVGVRAVAQRSASAPGEFAELHMGVHTPCDLGLLDVVVHRSLWPTPVRPVFECVSELGPLPQFPADRALRPSLPVVARARRVGAGPAALRTPEAHRHPELFQWICAARGLNPADFDVYRVRVPCPPVPSRIVMRLDMPYEPAT
jgi:hypothetical protein